MLLKKAAERMGGAGSIVSIIGGPDTLSESEARIYDGADRILAASKKYAYSKGFGLEYAAMSGSMTWDEMKLLGVAVGRDPKNPANRANLRHYFSTDNSKEPLRFFEGALRGEHGNNYQKAAKLIQSQSQDVFRQKYGRSTNMSRVGTKITGIIGVSESTGLAKHAAGVVSGTTMGKVNVVSVKIRDVLISHRVLKTDFPEREWIVMK